MTAWRKEELTKIGSAEEIEIAPLRQDGMLRKPVIIWVVRVGDNLFIRSYRGQAGAWFRGVQVRHEGCIWAAGVEVDVSMEAETDPDINDQIDEAYCTKYRHLPQYVAPMLTAEVRATTLKLLPQHA